MNGQQDTTYNTLFPFIYWKRYLCCVFSVLLFAHSEMAGELEKFEKDQWDDQRSSLLHGLHGHALLCNREGFVFVSLMKSSIYTSPSLWVVAVYIIRTCLGRQYGPGCLCGKYHVYLEYNVIVNTNGHTNLQTPDIPSGREVSKTATSSSWKMIIFLTLST